MSENTPTQVEPSADPMAEAEAAKAALEQAQNQPQESPDAGESAPDGDTDPQPSTDGGGDDVDVDPESFNLSAEETEEATDWSEQVEEQIFKHGKFTDHFKSKLAKDRGLSKGEIADMEAGALHRRTESVRDFMQTAGGQEFVEVQKWAQSTMSKEERDYYTSAAMDKNEHARRAAARDLLARYRASGHASAQIDGRPARPAQTGPQISGPQDMVNILNDSRGMSSGRSREQYEQERAQAALAFADFLDIPTRAHKK